MEAGEEIPGVSMKRQRAPLSDSEDNVFSSAEMNDGQKRRRLEAAGQENRSPKPSTSGRLFELGTKPDTPIVPSVRSRVQQLTQRREGAPLAAQRCLSDPGADGPSAIIHDKGFKEQLLSEDEFNQRMERFKAPLLNAGPAPGPVDLCPRSRSNFVSDIHQKLQGTTTPSSKQASRIRQEREQELTQLQFQPISENAWLKRSTSDPSLTEDDGADMKDGSFTEVPTTAEKPPVNTAGERARCESDGPAAAVALESSSEVQLQIEWKNQNAQKSEELGKEKDHKPLFGNEEERSGSQESEHQTVLKLSFSEVQNVSKTSVFEDENVSGVKQTQLESGRQDETETHNVSKEIEHSRSDVFSFGEDEQIDASSYAEEEIEPSTDEELRSWRYPQYKVHKEDESVMAEGQEGVCAEEEEGRLESSTVVEEKGCSDHSYVQDGECCLGETAGSSELQEDEKPRADEESVKDQATLNRDQENMESSEDCSEEPAKGDDDTVTTRPDTEGCTNEDDACQQTNDIQATSVREDYVDDDSNSTGPNSIVTQTEASPLADVSQTQTEYMEVHTEDEAQSQADDYAEPVDMDTEDPALSQTEVQASVCLLETDGAELEAVDERQGDGQPEKTHKVEAGESLKKVTFVLEPELINDSSLSEASISVDSRTETSMSDTELSSHDETNTSEIIDRMFEEVLEYAGRMEEQGMADDDDAEDRDSGIGTCIGDKDKMDTESEKEKSEEEAEAKEECDESNGDELLTFPPSGILSPLSKSVEAVVTPLRLAASQESNPPSLLLTPEETTTPPVDSAPLYSVDAYRTQRQNKPPNIQSVTPRVQRRAPEKSQPQQSVNMKEKIAALNEEAGKLQNVINQTLQALSCCTDEEHGRGSLEEAEAEKLLLVSCEKRSALLAEVSRLREERNLEAAAGEDKEYVSQQPCRGTVSITNIQLPLKVEFVCSSHSRAGRPSHYFFILIRYGPCNIIATPLATAADAKNGDTISFPTSVTLEDIRSSFEIDVEVYSLSHTSATSSSMDRATTKSRVTPRKLLSTITQRSNNSLTAAALPALNTRRSSNFCLVGSHKITLASLGHSKFPLDKMKLEGKIRRLLGDEFQEKVPFLSPLEGNIYLRLSSESHSNVQHHGFLTMFELISGYGVWHRRYFVLEGCNMCYWNHPNDKETKEAEGSIALSSSHSQCVRPVKRDSCARPFTFELVSNIPHQQQDDSQEALTKCWFSADTKQDRLDWMEKLSQALLDFHTWNRASATQTESQQSHTVSSGNLRESIL